MTAVPFDVEAVRQVLELHPSPPVDPVVLRRQWKHLLTDLEAACDEIERLNWVEQASRNVIAIEDIFRALPKGARSMSLPAFEVKHREVMDSLRAALAGGVGTEAT